MFTSKKIKIDKDLYSRVAHFAERAGYSSADEFIAHVLERAVAESDGDDDLENQRLRGLGYIA